MPATALAAILLVLTPHTGFEPLSVRVTLTIEPNYQNRSVCVRWEGPLSGAGCWGVEGQYAPRTHVYLINALPVGEYRVQAQLIQVGRTISTPTEPLRVLER